MSRISPDLLTDTLHLIALARQTAIAKGEQSKADQFAPVEGKLRSLVTETRQPAAPAAGVVGQSDFKALLTAAQSRPAAVQPANSIAATLERNQTVASMALGGITEIEIARQMGISREEVRLIVGMQIGDKSP